MLDSWHFDKPVKKRRRQGGEPGSRRSGSSMPGKTKTEAPGTVQQQTHLQGRLHLRRDKGIYRHSRAHHPNGQGRRENVDATPLSFEDKYGGSRNCSTASTTISNKRRTLPKVGPGVIPSRRVGR